MNKAYIKGKAFFEERKFEEANKYFDIALKETPYDPDLLSEKGVAVFNLGNKKEALHYLDRAQNLDPNNPYRYSSRAYILGSMGDIKAAIADYEKTIELDPEDIIAYNNLGLLLEQGGKKKQAKTTFKKGDDIAKEKGLYNLDKRRKDVSESESESTINEKQYSFFQYLKIAFKLLSTKKGRKEYLTFLKRGLKL